MKRMLAVLFGTTMLLAAFAVTSASADPGPNGNNDKGLCTAYFNGQKKGHDKNGSPGPFAALEEAAGAEAGATRDEIATAVYEWCETLAGIAGEGIEIGGQPNDNGRWTCTTNDNDTPDDTSDDSYNCTDNPDKGNGPNG